eukprot:2333519-Prymnesium_polylepis.1
MAEADHELAVAEAWEAKEGYWKRGVLVGGSISYRAPTRSFPTRARARGAIRREYLQGGCKLLRNLVLDDHDARPVLARSRPALWVWHVIS